MTRPSAEVLAALGSPRVVVVGDLILDRYVTGVVDRISPEAPIQVLRVESDERRLGGAGSVAHALAVLGARAVLVGVLGDDDSGRVAVERASAAGVDLRPVLDPSRPTSLKTRHLARSHALPQQVLRVDREDTRPVSGTVERGVLDVLDAALRDADAVLASDYQKGTLTPAVLERLVAWRKATGRPVLVDPKGEDFSRYRGVTGVKPNRAGAALATRRPVRTPAEAAEAGAALVDALDLAFALVTLDRDGMCLVERGGAVRHLPTRPREVFDVTGAGDIALATMGAVLGAGGTPSEGAELANVAAGLEVEHVGVVPLTREEIGERVREIAGSPGSKVVARGDVAALCARLRASGRRVVFTNGCFDVLHAGHVRLLRHARGLGDALVVGMNSDASVRRLKGDGRPVVPEDDRAEVLSALAAVDHVVVFDEDVPTALIEAVVPDVLVKGEDWRGRVVEGQAFVEAHGGRVVLAPLHPGRSTSATIDRIRGGGEPPARAGRRARAP